MHYHAEIPWLADDCESRLYSTDEPSAPSDIFYILSYVASELRDAAEYEHQSISALGESEDYEGAYHSWEMSEATHIAYLNLEAIANQGIGIRDRAPLYQGSDGTELLIKSAHMVLGADDYILKQLPLSYRPEIWQCHDSECELLDTEEEVWP